MATEPPTDSLCAESATSADTTTDADRLRILERELARERTARSELEHHVEHKTRELSQAVEHIKRQTRLVGARTATKILLEAKSLVDGAPRMLRALCDTLGWKVGALWLCDPADNMLQCATFWSVEKYPHFELVTRATRFPSGLGLPGRSWAAKQPAWIPNVVIDTNFPRAAAAEADGLHAGCAFPIIDRGDVRAVIELFSTDTRDIDEELLVTLDAVGQEIGNFLVRQDIERRLLIADRMASIGTLAAGVAHEINNPLAYVMANLEFVAEELRQHSTTSPSGFVDELMSAVNDAREGAERVRKIVRGLKTFSRADEERRGIQEIHRIIEVSINMTYNEIRHHARLVKDFGVVPLVEGDESRLGQVFINLLVNAAQSIPAGRAELNEIRITTRTDEEGRAVIEFRDTGCGVSNEIRERLFDPFFTTKGLGVGTGLGLSISHGIITALGGEIQVESEVGFGTVFRVILPSSSAVEVEQALPGGGSRTQTNTTTQRSGRILLLDDELMVLASVKRILANEHEVTAKTDAREALAQIAAGETFDVILCDLMMPEMTGMDFYAEVARTAPALADRIIFMTGGAFALSAREFLDQVPNHRMEKPFDAKALRAVIRAFVSQSVAPPSSPSSPSSPSTPSR